MPAFTSKSASQEFGRRIERLVASRVAGTPIEPELIRWIEGLPPTMRQRLLKVDLLDAQLFGTIKPLADHLVDFEASLLAANNTKAYVAQLVGRIKKVLDECAFKFWPDITASRLVTFLAELRRDKKDRRGILIQTSNFYLTAMKQFCKWLRQERRAGESPIGHVQMLNVNADRRHDRRPLSFQEMIWLLDTTENGPDRAGVSGKERALAYRLAAETGLRASELASLTVASFNLDADQPTVVVQAGYSKHRRQDVLVLKKSTAMLLKQHFASKMPTAPALKVLGKHSRTAVLRRDLQAAREAWLNSAPDAQCQATMAQSDFLVYQDRNGLYADFHAFRHATGSYLARGGVTPKVAQKLMRHSDINLTMSTYSHSFREDESHAVEKLPDLGQRPTKKRQADAG